MKALPLQLAKLCEENCLREKVLLSSSLMQGHQIIQLLALMGIRPLNLRPATTKSIAFEIAGIHLAQKKLEPLPEFGLRFLLEELFLKVSSRKGSYFQGLEAAEGIVSALSSAIHELRLCGMTSGELEESSFLDPRKCKDLREILAGYERHLSRERLYDYPELLRAATEMLAALPTSNEKLYILPSDMSFSPLERAFFDALKGEKIIISHDKPIGLATPKRYLESGNIEISREPKSDADRLRWLFEPASSPAPVKDGSISIFHGMGRRNELREVIRRVIVSGVRSDEVEIVHTSYDSYVPLIRSIVEKLGIATTFAEGLTVANTRPGRAIAGYLSWIGSDFEAVKLRHLFASGAVLFSVSDIKPSMIGKVLIDSQIGWGRDRYVPTLEHMIQDFNTRKKGASGSYAEYIAGLEKNAVYLAEILELILKEIPKPKNGGFVGFDILCAAASNFLSRFGNVGGELDAQAKKSIISALDEAAEIDKRELPLREVLGKIERMVQKIRIGQSGPMPGAVHVSSYAAGGTTGRKNTFIVGCEQGLFPGTALQDPILLDEEREKLHTGLTISSERLKESLYRMASLLASLDGKVTLSFPSYEVIEGKDAFPSTIILQAYRLATGAYDADYSTLEKALDRPAGYRPLPGREVDSADLWIGLVASDDGMKHARQSMLNCYPGLAAWSSAMEARVSGVYTKYDGVVPPDDRLDPREIGRVMSATALEKAAKCPFRFFIENVLGVSEIEELVRKPGEWLDFLGRGSVLHDIYAEFMKDLTERKEKPSFKKHRQLIQRIAEKALEEKKKELPAPSEAVFRQDKKSILQAAEFFLKMEEDRCGRVEPVMFEAGFGEPEPLAIDLGNKKKLLIKGRIDRIDRVGANEYEVWDYKSGSSRRYRGNSVLNGGKELQPGLYSIAAELILRGSIDKKGRVKGGGYLFPTEKGSGIEISRPRNDKNTLEAVGLLLEMMAGGLFIYTDDAKECENCECKPACGNTNKKAKFSDQNIGAASLLRRLRGYV
jgi:ATP-dependent helicase/nuclease subunit B